MLKTNAARSVRVTVPVFCLMGSLENVLCATLNHQTRRREFATNVKSVKNNATMTVNVEDIVENMMCKWSVHTAFKAILKMSKFAPALLARKIVKEITSVEMTTGLVIVLIAFQYLVQVANVSVLCVQKNATTILSVGRASSNMDNVHSVISTALHPLRWAHVSLQIVISNANRTVTARIPLGSLPNVPFVFLVSVNLPEIVERLARKI